jgi:hypothetical protein
LQCHSDKVTRILWDALPDFLERVLFGIIARAPRTVFFYDSILMSDFRYALRLLFKSPVFSGAVIVGLACKADGSAALRYE